MDKTTVKVPETATCLACEYPLRGLPEAVCPECGRAFIPDDPNTYRNGPAKPRWPFQPVAPPGWQAEVLPVAIALYLYSSSAPGGLGATVGLGACLVIPVGLAGITILVLDFVGRVVAVRADRQRASLDRGEKTRGGRWRWVILPTTLAIALSVILWSWPMRIRFHFSQPAFELAVRQVQTGADPRHLRGRFGSYEVGYIHCYKSGAIFFQTGVSGFDKVGIAFRPSDTSRRSRDKRLARYWFTEMW